MKAVGAGIGRGSGPRGVGERFGTAQATCLDRGFGWHI